MPEPHDDHFGTVQSLLFTLLGLHFVSLLKGSNNLFIIKNTDREGLTAGIRKFEETDFHSRYCSITDQE
jgi:hypothetical protein